MAISDITVAVSADFFSAFASIPKKQQTRVLNFVNKFRTDPTSSGINYETINVARDKRLRSVRIDGDYRGIVMKPEKGNVYMLLWVDQHDKAYAWAKERICHINPETGSIQVYSVEESGRAPEGEQEEVVPGMFDSIRDRELLKLGIPEAQIRLVRTVHSIVDLYALQDKLPIDSYEALHFIANGDKLEDVIMLIDSYREDTASVDTEDFAKALHNPISLQKFFVDPSEHELELMLNAPLEKWRVFLHPSQRSLVEKDWNGPTRVLGGAGTGKTVVALHRTKWLAENRCKDVERILLTTFTKNLAADIESNLKTICSREALEKILVVNLDKWVSDFLRKNDFPFTIAYGFKTRELWDQALTGLPDEAHERFARSFFREEWEHVIQPEEIMTLKDYFKVIRVGRGVRMDRRERKLIWPAFEEYRILLNENRLREPADAMMEARHILLKSDRKPFRHVIVDEAQDMSKQAFLLLRAMVPEDANDMFITGDAHQRIYGRKIVLGQCGINIVGRARKLRINYRTTEEIRRWAVAVVDDLPIDDLDGGNDNNSEYNSLVRGQSPEIFVFDSMEQEVDAIASFINDLKGNAVSASSICIVASLNNTVERYSKLLNEKDISTYIIKRSVPDDRHVDGVRMATMHRVKGLEFDYVILAGMNENSTQYFSGGSKDETVLEYKKSIERALVYVASTRARKHLFVTCHGKKSPLLPEASSLNV